MKNPFQKLRDIWNTSNIGRLIIVATIICLCGCCFVVYAPVVFPISSTSDSNITNTPLPTEIAINTFTLTPKTSELPPTDEPTNTPLPSTITSTPLPTEMAINTFTLTPKTSELTPMDEPTNTPLPPTAVYTATPIATPDPYMHIGGDWPNGIWDYIFKPEKGARGHLKVYMGEQKSYIFEIIGAANNCSSTNFPSGQGYLVRYPEGNEEWKDRRALEKYPLYVLRDELTDIFKDFNWTFYQCP